VTALDHSTQGKQFILANHEGSTPGKVFLTTPDAAGVNQLFFTSPDLSAPHLQVSEEKMSLLLYGQTKTDRKVNLEEETRALCHHPNNYA
jgi:hypothetical protein